MDENYNNLVVSEGSKHVAYTSIKTFSQNKGQQVQCWKTKNLTQFQSYRKVYLFLWRSARLINFCGLLRRKGI